MAVNCMSGFGKVAFDQGQYEDALQWYERALAGCQKTLGTDHPSTLGTVHNMAIVFREQRRYDEALQWCERALAGQERISGKDHSSTLSTINNMTTIFMYQGRYKGYKKLYEEDHKDTIDALTQVEW